MKTKHHTVLFILLMSIIVNAQVGIGTNTPSKTLEVVGNAKLSGELYLENPGGITTINNQKFLIETTSGNIERYDIATAKYGPVNYAQYDFNNLAEEGLRDYDTKIQTSKYILAVHGYRLSNSNARFRSNTGDSVEGLVCRAYEKSGTWWLQFYCNNSKFHDGAAFIQANLSLNVVVYRKNLLASGNDTPITVNMGGSSVGSVAAPPGY